MAIALELQEQAVLADDRFDERQLDIMRQMMAQGMDPMEAKLRVMNIAAPPDHFKVIPSRNLDYPKMVYHPNGKMKIVRSADEYATATDDGWVAEPMKIHMDKLQLPNQPHLRKLENELKAQLAAVQAQQLPEDEPEEVPAPRGARRK